LVTSLVYFILEIAYRGEFLERLHFIFFCFVSAAVLISRIAMTRGRGLALIYAAALAFATALATNRLVDIPSNNALGVFGLFLPYLLILSAWWCIDILTHDCTHTGSDQEAGLLDLGIVKSAAKPPEDEDEEAQKDAKPKTWLEQYTSDRE